MDAAQVDALGKLLPTIILSGGFIIVFAVMAILIADLLVDYIGGRHARQRGARDG
jgi:hypothetical protein